MEQIENLELKPCGQLIHDTGIKNIQRGKIISSINGIWKTRQDM